MVSSLKISVQDIRIGMYIVVNGFFYEVYEQTMAYSGKHGSTKKIVRGYELISRCKKEFMFHVTAIVDSPLVTKHLLVDFLKNDMMQLVEVKNTTTEVSDESVSAIETDQSMKLLMYMPLNEMGFTIKSMFENNYNNKSIFISTITLPNDINWIVKTEFSD
jgi:translation elongation factor P/translation initiation factor 5A